MPEESFGLHAAALFEYSICGKYSSDWPMAAPGLPALPVSSDTR